MNKSGNGLFKGTAKYYAAYRPQYPESVIDFLVKKIQPNRSGRLLDIGCGSGTLALPLSKYFHDVVAIDIDDEMVSEARALANEQKIHNINWVINNAAELDDSHGTFDVTTFGNSLHWFDPERILKKVYEQLNSGGSVVNIGGSTIWRYAPEPWQQKTLEIIKKYLGPDRMTTQGKYTPPEKSFEEYFKLSGLKKIEKTDFEFSPRTLTAEEVINLQYSTSYAAKDLFGDRLSDFETELHSSLLSKNPRNEFIDRTKGSILIGRKL